MRKKNVQDATLRNVRAYKKALAKLEHVVKEILWQHKEQDYLLEDIYERLSKLEKMHPEVHTPLKKVKK